jgi:6-phosphofructokinase 1
MVKKIGILTGGGDCPGLNQAIRAAVMRAIDYGFECVGILEGWKGLIECKTMPLKLGDVEELMNKGGTIVGTSRTNPYKKEGVPKICMENLKKLELDAIIAMGGEDTLGVAAKFHKDFNMPVVGVPKTMDNDLSCTDYTFGFDTSVTVAVDAAERLKDTGKSHRRIMILEVMGRHAGWVALFTGLAAGADVILIPEEKVDTETICKHLKEVYSRKNTALVVVSEGVEVPGAEKLAQEKDEFGHVILKERGVGEKIADLIKKNTEIETRTAVIGHIQRGGSPTLFDRILALRVGTKSVDLVAENKFGYMVALKGNEIVPVPLEEATGKLKTVTEEWLNLVKILTK